MVSLSWKSVHRTTTFHTNGLWERAFCCYGTDTSCTSEDPVWEMQATSPTITTKPTFHHATQKPSSDFCFWKDSCLCSYHPLCQHTYPLPDVMHVTRFIMPFPVQAWPENEANVNCHHEVTHAVVMRSLMLSSWGHSCCYHNVNHMTSLAPVLKLHWR